MKFFHTTGKDQYDYVNKNIDRLVELQNSCSPSNYDKYTDKKIENEEEVIVEYNNFFIESIYNFVKDYQTENKFFFLLDDANTIIAYCIGTHENVFEYIGNNQIETYRPLDIDVSEEIIKDLGIKKIFPYICNFCKHQSISGIGKILLNKVIEYYSTNTEYDKVYLIPESVNYKNNYTGYLEESCEMDEKKFYESNMKLVKYYLDNSFIPSKNLFYGYYCGEKIMFLNVLYTNINIKY